MRTSYVKDGVPIACGTIDPLPGSSQVAVFHSAFVLPQYRNDGNGEQAHIGRLQAATDALYDYALVTIDGKNEAQKNILINNNWRCLDTFESSKTGHIVQIWGRRL